MELLDFIGSKRTRRQAHSNSCKELGVSPLKRAKVNPGTEHAGDHGSSTINIFQSKLAARQQKGRRVVEEQLTREQRKVELLSKLNDPAFSKMERKTANERKSKLAKDEEEATREMLVEMAYANDQDHNSISEVMQG